MIVPDEPLPPTAVEPLGEGPCPPAPPPPPVKAFAFAPGLLFSAPPEPPPPIPPLPGIDVG